MRKVCAHVRLLWPAGFSPGRNVEEHQAPLLAGLFLLAVAHEMRSLSWQRLFLLLPSMAADGDSALMDGVLGGFPRSKQWLPILTGRLFPATFCRGVAPDFFDSWKRLISGIFLGMGVVWFADRRFYANFNRPQNALQVRLGEGKRG